MSANEALLQLTQPAPARVLAAGAWLKNAAARLDGARLQWSPLHGDLGDPASCAALEASAAALLAEGAVDAIAHDLHPDFHSTRLAQRIAQEIGVPAVAVQHHHAHIAAVQAEHGIGHAVIGLALDGVGLGTDGTAWGGELLWVDGAQWRRLGHLRQLRLPGGDAAAREPWRMAASVLHALGENGDLARLGHALPQGHAAGVRTLLQRGLNCPVTSSAGRWFDAAAGLLGLCTRQAHEAQAAMALEAAAREWLATHAVPVEEELTPVLPDGQLDLLPLARRLLALADARRTAEGAALFHVQLADGLARWAAQAARVHGVDTVALGGGCFFNAILRERVVAALRAQGLRVLRPERVNCGDAGLALGQAWVAAHTVAGGDVPAATEEMHACA
ncbi:MAG: carbamoyltransferase HypF [Burkholderiales bacterium]|nr:carbamoyltransferase HypF [Burkholderiales bacterium]